ncbi:hypothetical protein V2J33_09405 [Staphylococcus saccharolyticus]|uniref:hypothetical protein n=1 Tax=Staphylococcus saccharolyticus TaxID=33028 RepID=UPI001EF047C4|nr:hypothetical protein [Staphylococcus saccharolyticus]
MTGKTEDKERLVSLINQHAGDVETSKTLNILSYLSLDSYTLSLLFLLGTFIVYCHYVQRNKRDLKMLSDLGYSKRNLFMFIMRELKNVISSYIIFSIIFTVLIYLIIYKDSHLLYLLIIITLTMLLNIILLITITIVSLNCFQKGFSINKGKVNIKLVLYLYILLAIIMSLFLSSSIDQVINNTQKLQSKIFSMNSWENTKNVYQPELKYKIMA